MASMCGADALDKEDSGPRQDGAGRCEISSRYSEQCEI